MNLDEPAEDGIRHAADQSRLSAEALPLRPPPEGVVARLNKKKVIGLLLCLGALLVVAAGWA